MLIVISSSSIKPTKGEGTLSKQEFQVVKQHQVALIKRQKQVRREVPLADERILNLVFTD